MRSDTEQTRLIVCERPLQEHTHTWPTLYHPQGNGKRRTKYSMCMCVLCVWGGSVSIKNIVVGRMKTYFFPNENIVVGQAKEHFFPSETQRDLGETPTRENRSPSSVYIDNVYINVKSPLQT